jgi:protein-disulfide isomerase
MNKGTAIVGFFLCFLAGIGLMWGIEHKRDAKDTIGPEVTAVPASHGTAKIPVTDKDPIWGNPDALVTIVQFSDFQCPFCSRVEATMDKIKETYGPSNVRVVWKNQPLSFHPNAKPAAEAAQAVFSVGGSEAFWKFHKTAFANQQQLSPESYRKWAAAAGVDAAKFEAALKSPDVKAKVEADAALGAQVGANGTPAFRINGVTLSGAQPFEQFKQVIDDQLAEAKKLVAAGTPRSEVYPTAVNKNAQAAPGDQQQKPQQPQKPPEDDTSIWKVPVAKDDPVKGPKDALVTIVIFSDFQCPYCKRVEDTLKQVAQTYPNDVRFVWKDNTLPFHKRARPAATLARAAYIAKGDAGFWQAHDALFESQPALEDSDLEGIAKKLGLNWAQIKKAIEADKYSPKFEDSAGVAAAYQANGTPHFFVNGRRIKGAQPFEGFKTVVDEQLARAKAAVAAGTPKAQIYEAMIKDGKEPPAAPEPETKVVPAPTADNPFKGGAAAKLVIQQFSDFQCPFCSRVEPTVKQIEAAYGDRVKIVWRNLPLPMHSDAHLAAEAAVEAFVQKGNVGFWRFHEKLFEAQGTPDGQKRAGLEKIAQEIGLDMEKFKAALDSGKHKARVDADAEIAQKAGINGTPAFVVGKYFVSGAMPFTEFKKIIDRALKER